MTELSDADKAAVDGIVASGMAANHIPGFLLGTCGPRGDYTKAYGVADRGFLGRLWTKPMTTGHYFRVGSVTKMFTAQAVLIQVDRGTLILSDSVAQFVPGVPVDVTVEHLLTHRSGIYDYATDLRWQANYWNDPTSALFTAASAVALALSQPLAFVPGSQFGYSSTNYILLGMILESLTGNPVGQVITDDVITPLDLTDTSYPTTCDMPAPACRGYSMSVVLAFLNWWWFKDVTLSSPRFSGAAGAIISTLGDMMRYVESLKTEPLLSPDTRALRQTLFQPTGNPAVSYGLGIGRLANGWVGHSGKIIGYETATYFDPVTGARLVTMGNLQGNVSETVGIVTDVIDALYPDP